MATRRILLETAAELFIERGYDVVSMQDIADRAEITKGGVYGHFRSKGQLLVEVIRWKLAEREESTPFLDAMREAESAVGLLRDEEGRAIRLLELDAAAASRHDPDVAAGMADFSRERRTAVRDALVGVVEDPDTVAWVVLAIESGSGVTDAIAIPPPPVDRLWNVLQALISD